MSPPLEQPGTFGPGPYLTQNSDLGPLYARVSGGTKATRIGDLVAAATLPRIRPSLSNMYLPIYSGGPSNIGSQTQITLGANFVLEKRFTGIRLILGNYNTNAVTLLGLSAAASAVGSASTTPSAATFAAVNADGSAAPWANVPAGDPSLTIPAAVTATQPGLSITPLLPIESIDRTDGGTGLLLFTRASNAPNTTAYFNQAADTTSTAVINQMPGRPVTYFYVGGDVASAGTQGNLTGPAQINGLGQVNFVVLGVIFEAVERCITTGHDGDSLTKGYGTSSYYGGYGRYAAAALSSAACGVSYVDMGFDGQQTPTFVARAKALVNACVAAGAGVPIHVLGIPIDSPNDYGTNTRVQQETNMLGLADWATSQGIVPAVLTPIPFPINGIDCGSAASAQQRVISGAKVRKLPRGIMVVDAQAIISGYVPTAANLATVPANMLGPDGRHINDVGESAIGTAYAAQLALLLV